jgi:enoyl-CoA hydratase/carnithine racemase
VIEVVDVEGVRTITLNRPERLNAFDAEHYHALADAVVGAEADAAVRVVVLTGTGRAFSAGADLTAIAEPGMVEAFSTGFDRMLDAFGDLDKPVVAAVNGLAVGVGVTLLLHLDVVFADASARFRTPFPQVNTTPEAGSSVLLPRLVGPQWARWMLLSGEWVDAATAERIGLVLRVCAEGTVLDEALAIARNLALLSPETLAASKRLQRHGLAALVAEARQREGDEARALPGSGLPTRPI